MLTIQNLLSALAANETIPEPDVMAESFKSTLAEPAAYVWSFFKFLYTDVMTAREFWLIAVVVLVLIIVRYFWGGEIVKTRPNILLFGYALFYTDQKTKQEGVIHSKLLKSKTHNVKGKPDFIYKRVFGRALIPIELKSGTIGDSPLPRQGDLMQLVAYFLIIEEEFGCKPRKGLLVYKDWMFRVRNTRRLRAKLKNTLEQMRTALETHETSSQPSYIKCRSCICKGTVCKFYEKARV